jgi:hypothetical protein
MSGSWDAWGGVTEGARVHLGCSWLRLNSIEASGRSWRPPIRALRPETLGPLVAVGRPAELSWGG